MTEQEENTLNDLSYIMTDDALDASYRSMLVEVYHLLKEKLKVEKPNRVDVDVPISEYDVEQFKTIVYDNDSMSWSFADHTGKSEVSINFVNADEYEQRAS